MPKEKKHGQKDCDIIRFEPHKLIEGIVLASHAMQIDIAYIYIRGEFYNEALILQKAIEETNSAKLVPFID